MADQQRSVIVTAIILALILGGALVWLLNRTPADQLATQAPQNETADQAQAGNEQAAAQELIPADQNNQLLAQAPESQISPTGEVQGVAATAPTGPAEMSLLASFASLALGGGGLLTLGLPRFQGLGR